MRQQSFGQTVVHAANIKIKRNIFLRGLYGLRSVCKWWTFYKCNECESPCGVNFLSICSHLLPRQFRFWSLKTITSLIPFSLSTILRRQFSCDKTDKRRKRKIQCWLSAGHGLLSLCPTSSKQVAGQKQVSWIKTWQLLRGWVCKDNQSKLSYW